MAVSLWMALLGAFFAIAGPIEGTSILKLFVAMLAIFNGAAGIAQIKKDTGSTSLKTQLLFATTLILTVTAVLIR